MKSKNPPWALYPIAALLVFVFLHSLMPFDHRIRMGFKPFEPEMSLGLGEIWYSVKKWRHILWFACFFPLARSVFQKHATAKAFGALMLVTFLIEFEECFVAGKHGRLADVLPNLIGAGVGAVAWHFFRRLQLSRRRRASRTAGQT